VGLYSDDPNAKKPDQKPMILKLKDLTGSLKAAIEPLRPGEFTAPITMPNGLMIFQLVDKKLGENRDFAAKKAKLDQELRLIELQNQTNKWLGEQHQRISVKRMDD
jgi:parvulin-like peptidyl-prolyl isomerase